ncbi:MAG: hypothetical protein SVK08_13685 [Halobacteriota archaeon]|nr:hypothetical protein [Halobacteriota archaeon]
MKGLELEVRKLERRETKAEGNTTSVLCEIGENLTGVAEMANEMLAGACAST